MNRQTRVDITWGLIFIGALLLTAAAFFGCAGKSYRQMAAEEYIEQRACHQAKRWTMQIDQKVVGVPCDLFPVTYIEAHQIACGDNPTDFDSVGCFAAEEHKDDKGWWVEYSIKIASFEWGWEHTLVHEYCHALLYHVNNDAYIDFCHTEE